MKLPIKKKYFDEIKTGNKTIEYRDSHITFVCEETGETLRKNVVGADIQYKHILPLELQNDKGLFTDDRILVFYLSRD